MVSAKGGGDLNHAHSRGVCASGKTLDLTTQFHSSEKGIGVNYYIVTALLDKSNGYKRIT